MQDFMLTLLACSATTSALGLLYLALTPLLARRYSEKVNYYAWLIIVAGLIIPFRPHFAGAIVHYDPPATVPYFQNGTIMAAVHQGSTAPATMPPAATGLSLWHILFLLWFAGVIAFIVFHMLRHRRFIKMMARWSYSTGCEQEAALLDRMKAEMGIKKQVGVYRCPSVASPMLLGLIKPRILLPPLPFPMDETAFILRHELIHYKRGDLWYKCATLLAVAIHWFNPVTYLLAKAIDAACELSCDAETVRNADLDIRQRYSEIIIGVVRYRSKFKTALSTNFYGGKSGMKKRIYSIMDTSGKKTGIALLCGMLVLTIAAGMAFATGTTEAKGPTLESNGPLPNAQAVSEADLSMMSRFDPETGKTYYSWDLGNTWKSLTNEEYDSMFPSPAIEWWTYDGYKVWMDEQIKALQSLADDGVSDYYDKDGVLRDFSQADVNEAAALYQSILENIKNGHRVSKTIDGSADSAASYNPQDIMVGTAETHAIAASGNYAEPNRDYSEYAPFGLSYDTRTDDFYYNGELVRRFYDERTSLVVTRTFNPNGVVDITAIRNEKNELTGLYKHSQQEFDERTKAMSADTSLSAAEQYAVAAIETDGKPAYDYSKYADYGLVFDKATEKLYYKGKLVRYFEDSYPLGENMASYIDHFDEEGTIDVHAIRDLSKIVYNPDGSYDPSGVLVSVEPYSQAEFDARDITQYIYDSLIPQITIAESIPEDLRPYKDWGMSYDRPIASEASEASASAFVGASETPLGDSSYSASSTPVYTNAVESAGSSGAAGQTFEVIFEKYKAYGIAFDSNSVMGGLGNIYYNGKLVKTFIDINPDGGVISCSSSDGGEITVRTLYNTDGQLTGLEVTGA